MRRQSRRRRIRRTQSGRKQSMKNVLGLVFAGLLMTTSAAAEPTLHIKIVETITDIAAGCRPARLEPCPLSDG